MRGLIPWLVYAGVAVGSLLLSAGLVLLALLLAHPEEDAGERIEGGEQMAKQTQKTPEPHAGEPTPASCAAQDGPPRGPGAS